MAKKKSKKKEIKKKKEVRKKKDVKKKKDIKKKKNSKKKKDSKKKLQASDLTGKKSLKKNKKKGEKKKVEKKKAVWNKEVSRVNAPGISVKPAIEPVKVADHSSNYSVKDALPKIKTLETKQAVLEFTEGETRLTIVRALPAVLARIEKQVP